MYFLKKIWRRFLRSYVNSSWHVRISRWMHALEFDGFVLTFSQFGEDMILLNYFREQKKGFYVDVGANRPIQGSNTFKLYLKGWRGINIDGNQRLIDQFNRVRKRDINLCAIISNQTAPIRFFLSGDDRISTISDTFKREADDGGKYAAPVTMTPVSLESVLDQHLPPDTPIDFLSIDVEGHDYEVLISNNFLKYRPRIICIEYHPFSFDTFRDTPIFRFLDQQGYIFKGFAYPNMFFEEKTGSYFAS